MMNSTTITSVIESIKSDTEMVVITPVGFRASTQTTSASFTRRRTKLQDADKNVALSRMPYDVVKTLLTEDNASVSDTSFKIRRQFVATLSSSGTATITAGTNELFFCIYRKRLCSFYYDNRFWWYWCCW